jgi:hypothetical protein
MTTTPNEPVQDPDAVPADPELDPSEEPEPATEPGNPEQ